MHQVLSSIPVTGIAEAHAEHTPGIMLIQFLAGSIVALPASFCQYPVSYTHLDVYKRQNEYPPVTDAVVVVSDNAGNRETLRPNEAGRYVATSIRGTERRTYHLSVTYDEVEYTATSYMPPRVEIDSLTLWKLPVKDVPDPQVHFVDPMGEENQYYRYVLRINGVQPLLQDRLEDRLISTENVDGSVIRQPIFISYVNSGRDDDPIEQDDVVTVEMQCIDKDVYRFFDTLYRLSLIHI